MERVTATVDLEEAKVIQNPIGGEALRMSSDLFRHGLEVGLEHATAMPDCNVTGTHPLATGRIVLAHLKEGLDYYARLACMELEMEITVALASGDCERAARKRLELADA
ncbi:DUF5661 family protein [Pseudaestuariivita atlantica]|uniref:Uncharacterized protein n=1 Tax=Pseudaestuariivita atlantica TaxID=1317121 RepID=A0A0L1JS93_9RHOB|nr:DUF5661 family protein [Pseudaestuariivita atlantica]KNG94611.1 hypothetical protein ATO11_04190 [Pseudaestuariivita atlantica]